MVTRLGGQAWPVAVALVDPKPWQGGAEVICSNSEAVWGSCKEKKSVGPSSNLEALDLHWSQDLYPELDSTPQPSRQDLWNPLPRHLPLHFSVWHVCSSTCLKASFHYS